MFKKLPLGLLLISPFSVLAHPHAFIDMQTNPLVKDNQLIGFSTQWLLDEASSSAVLYDVKQAKGDKAAQQKLVDEVIANVVNEHYFSYVFDKENHKIKYKKQPENYGMRVKGNEVEYYFDFLLAQPQTLQNNEFTLMTYDSTYYVAMRYAEIGKRAVDFSALPANCKGEVLEPNVDEKIQSYASSLDKSQKNEDDSLGALFAQKVKIKCE